MGTNSVKALPASLVMQRYGACTQISNYTLLYGVPNKALSGTTLQPMPANAQTLHCQL